MDYRLATVVQFDGDYAPTVDAYFLCAAWVVLDDFGGDLCASRPEEIDPLDRLFLGHGRDLIFWQPDLVDQLP